MKTPTLIVLSCLGWSAVALAQMPPMPGGAGPDFGGGMAKLFGETQAFTAKLEMETSVGEGQTMFFPGEFAFDQGKTRYTLDLARARGGPLGEMAVAQMELLGLATMVIVAVPETNTKVILVPGLLAYTPEGSAAPPPASAATPPPAPEITVQTTELARETVDGRATVKNKNLITVKGAAPQEIVTWNAPDLKNFPIKISLAAPGEPPVVMTFKDVKFAAPPADAFTIPKDYTRYNSMEELVMLSLMRRMNASGGPGGAGLSDLLMLPPGGAPPPPTAPAGTTPPPPAPPRNSVTPPRGAATPPAAGGAN